MGSVINNSISSPITNTTPLPSIPFASTSKSIITQSSNSSFSTYRNNLKEALNDLLEELKDRRLNDINVNAIADELVVQYVEKVIEKAGKLNGKEEVEAVWKSTVIKSSVDRALEQVLFEVALQPIEADQSASSSYGLLTDLMDIILTFAEKDYADQNLPLSCLSGLLDLQTIAGCHHIFDYIESRRERLTKNMNPQQGKGPLLLKLLNELLRRLPKSKSTDVIFSGRILMFLSSVFPLAEKSGVNLRGNFNTGKGTTFEVVKSELKEEKIEEGAMEVDKVDSSKEDEDNFYTTFWSLQRYFNNPPVLFTTSTSTTPDKDPFVLLQHGLTQTLEAFAAATAKEKRLLGAGSQGNVISKVKVEESNIKLDDQEAVKEHYFFPKFLTSPNLLELEIADSSFRRQILVQMMVLYQYLLSFTVDARLKDSAIATNSPVLLPHVLTPANEKWIKELKSKTLTEMESMQTGRPFSNTVELILSREQNWINWKLKSCLPYEKPPVDTDVKSKLAKQKLTQVIRKPKNFPYALGNSTLANLWRKNTTTLDSFEVEPSKESFDQLFTDWRKCNKIVDQKRGQLKQLEESNLPADASKILSLKYELEEGEKKSKALHWRAIRIASTTHLHLFSKIGEGNLELLVTTIEAEARAIEEALSKALEPEVEIKEEVETPDISITEEVVDNTLVSDAVNEVEPVEVTSRDGDQASSTTSEEDINEILLLPLPTNFLAASDVECTTSIVIQPGTPKRSREVEGVGFDGVLTEMEENDSKRLKLDGAIDVEMK